MKIINWKTSSDFFVVLALLRESEEEIAIVVYKNTPFGWFHCEILKQLFSTKKFVFITGDMRIKKVLKSAGIRLYPSLGKMNHIVPEGFQIIQENITPLEYVRFHIFRFFSAIFSFRKKIQFRRDIFVVKHSSWYMLVLGIVVILLLMIGIVSLTTPHAVINITPQINVQNAIRNVTFALEDALSGSGQIPVRKDIITFEFKKEYSVNAFDPTSLERARGIIKVVNSDLKPLKIKPQTRVVVDTLVFRTESWLAVPGAKDSRSGEATVSVIADPIGSDGVLIGKKGNIPENTTLYFPGLSGTERASVLITSLGAFTGGGDKFKNLLSSEEYARIEKLFRDEFVQNAREQLLKKSYSEPDFIPLPIPETITALDMTTLSDKEAGTYVDRVTFSGKGNFIRYLYHVPTLRKALLDYAQMHLLKNTESLVEISQSPPDIITILSQSEDPWSVKATAQIPVQILYDFSSSIGQKTLQNVLSDLLGADKSRAEKTLLNHPYIKSVDIRLTPFWASRLPNTLDLIYIKVGKI